MEELSQHILDVAFNSLEAGADRLEITVSENILINLLQIEVRDNGRGITPADIPRVMDPFYTTKKEKKVGLGIPLFREAVERCGGLFEIKPAPRAGTVVTATFPHDHLDRAPLGDIAGTLSVLMAGNNPLRLTYRHRYNERVFSFDTKDFESQLGEDIPMRTPEVLVWLEKHLAENIGNLKEADTLEKFGRTG